MKNMEKCENVDLENELEAYMAIGGSNEKHDSVLKTSQLNKKRQWTATLECICRNPPVCFSAAQATGHPSSELGINPKLTLSATSLGHV
jgi:hypothetical protein